MTGKSDAKCMNTRHSCQSKHWTIVNEISLKKSHSACTKILAFNPDGIPVFLFQLLVRSLRQGGENQSKKLDCRRWIHEMSQGRIKQQNLLPLVLIQTTLTSFIPHLPSHFSVRPLTRVLTLHRPHPLTLTGSNPYQRIDQAIHRSASM